MADTDRPDVTVSYAKGDTPITLPDLAVLGVKLIGLYAIVRGVFRVADLSWFVFNPDARQPIYLVEHIQLAINLASGIFLIWQGEWVVSRVFRLHKGGAPPLTVGEHAQAIGFSIAGVLLMTWGLADLGGLAGRAVLSRVLELDDQVEFIRFLDPLIEFVAGLVLFLRARGLAALWHRMRYGGVRVRAAE